MLKKKKRQIAIISFIFIMMSLFSFSAYAMPAGMSTLRVGSSGENVEKLQQKLSDKGYFNFNVTGYYGVITETAVRDFQKGKDLVADGIAGSNTLDLLFGKGTSTTSAPAQTETLWPGDSGESVKKLQIKLKEVGDFPKDVACTEYYGSITKIAVQSFQKRKGLFVDGIAGKNTLTALYGGAADAKVSTTAALTTQEKIVNYAKQFLGVPYVYGANGPDAFDCSGFTTYVYKEFGYTLKRSAYDQGYDSSFPKLTRAQLKVGDLVVLDTEADSDLSDHTGIYIGNGEFIHATSSVNYKCVKISSLDSGFYERVFSWGRRIVP